MCENKTVAILNRMQEGKTALIKKDGGEMLIAIVLDKPLTEAQALVDDPDTFMLEITKIIQNNFFPSNAFMAFARSFNMFNCMSQNKIN